jgi:hypothetical protein
MISTQRCYEMPNQLQPCYGGTRRDKFGGSVDGVPVLMKPEGGASPFLCGQKTSVWDNPILSMFPSSDPHAQLPTLWR